MVPEVTAGSNDYLGNEKDSPAYKFVEEGYDVWLVNFRGSYLSAHSTLSQKTWEYWDFY